MPNVVSLAVVGSSRKALDEIEKVKKQISGLTTSAGWKNLVMGVGVGAGVGAYNMAIGAIHDLGGALVESVQKAADEQAGIERLTTSLRANVPAWNGSTAAIEQTIRSRERLGFTDGALRDSLSLLVAATHDTGKAFEIQATAMDLARFKGVDLQTASEALVKVEGGQFRALKSLGIVLKDGATQTEALAAVQKVAQGQAETYGTTFSGSMAAMNAAMENLQEEIGSKFLPVLTPLVKMLADFVSSGMALPVVAAVAAGAFATIAAALLPTVIEITAASGGLNLLIAALTGLGVLALTTAGKTNELGSSMRAFGEHAGATSEKVAEAAQKTATIVVKRLTALPVESFRAGADAAAKFADGLTSIPSDVADAVKKLRDVTKSGLSVNVLKTKLLGILASTDFATGLASKRPDVAATTLALGEQVIAGLAALVGPAYAAGAQTWLSWKRGLIHETGSTSERFDQVYAFDKMLKDAFKSLGGKMPDLGTLIDNNNASSAAADRVKAAFDKMKRAGNDYYDALHRKTMQSIDDARREMNARYDAQIKSLDAGVQAARDALDAQRSAREEARLQSAVANATDDQSRMDAQQALQDFLADKQLRAMEKDVETQKSAIEAQRDSENAKLDAIKQAAQDKFDAEKTSFDNLESLTNTRLTALEERWKKYADSVTKSLASIGMGSPTATPVEGKATGGAVSAGRPYIVGEKGPELFFPGASGAIVPNGALGGGSIALNVNLTGAAVFDPYGTAAQQVATALLPGLKRALTASGMSLA